VAEHRSERWRWLGPKECKWNHANAITPAIGLCSGGDHYGIEQIISNLFLQPFQVSHISVVNVRSEFHLNGEHLPISSNDEKVNFVKSALCAEMTDVGLCSLGKDSNALGDERFE
jgi:hypothetical protein